MSTTHVATLITPNGINVFVRGQLLTVGNDHPNFGKIKDAIARKAFDTIPALADVVTSVRNWLNDGKDFELKGDQVYLNGTPFSEAVTTKVLDMIKAGADANPLYAFLRKVRTNPSKIAQDELLLFCVANGFMIHEDGDLIAYKSVRGDYMDIHSGKFRNAVGDVNTMDRGTVDDRRHNTCSTGLHFASHGYASTWAGEIDGRSRRLMVMKINPRDVVSIPSDYNNQKGRCCRYEVIAEVNGGKALPKKEVYTNDCLSVKSAAEVAREKEATRAAIRAEIARKSDVLSRQNSKYADVRSRALQVQRLGGDATALLAEQKRVLDLIRQIEGEIASQRTKLAAV